MRKLPALDMSSGSLGNGLSLGLGMALATRALHKDYRVFVLMGDGEQSEGSVWEAVMNAKRYKLGNLVVFIDNNNLEADGYINYLTSLGDIGSKYRAFGWNVIDIDGNDITQLVDVVDKLPLPNSDIPTVIIAHTIKGYGVSFMEDNVKWHAGKITADERKKALLDLEKKRESYE